MFGALLVIAAALTIVTSRQAQEMRVQVRVANDIARGAGELVYLAEDYLIYRESRQLERWSVKFGMVSAQVSGLRPEGSEQRELVRNIRDNQQRLGEVFDTFASGDIQLIPGKRTVHDFAFLQVYWSRITIPAQALVSDASDLVRLLRIQMDRSNRANTAAVFSLMGMFGVYIFLIYLMIQRRVLKSIEILQEGTAVVGSGKLDFVTEEKKNDEIGDLSRAFNRMTTKLRKRTAELERKNQELQEFAFVASHDLNEPLRKVQAFGSLLSDKSGDPLSEKQRDYIARMTGAADRMRELLEALLRYSRIESKGEEFRPTELEGVVRDAISDMEVGIRNAGAQVSVDPLPVVRGDPNQLRQLFQNLIGNAVKYRRPECGISIKVYGEENNGKCSIFVEDNGIGFDEKYLDKIFQPFQRLHGKNEYSGLGIGLAICKKIVERHRGTINARSKPGEGSTFIITLPADGESATAE